MLPCHVSLARPRIYTEARRLEAGLARRGLLGKAGTGRPGGGRVIN